MQAKGFLRPTLAIGAMTLAFAACGDSDGGDDQSEQPEQSDAERWAAEVCGTVDTWRTDVETAVAELPDEVAAAGSVDAALDAVDATLDAIVADGQEAMDAIRSSELPETEAGQELQAEMDEVSGAIDQTGQAVTAAQDAAGEGLPQLITAIGEAISVAGTALSTVTESWAAIDELDLGAEVSDAVAADPSCQAVSE